MDPRLASEPASEGAPPSPRRCACAGTAHCQPVALEGVTRRDFLAAVSAGAAATWLSPVWARAADTPPSDWVAALHRPAGPRVFRSQVHTDARMHLGGIGTGNFEIGADGQCTTWQLFNTLRDGQVPFHFGVRVGETARLLQTVGGPDVPRVAAIELRGEYPVATLRFVDADLPIALELDAFTPFAPLDTALSSVPLAAFVFRVRNPGPKPLAVSLAAFLLNPVGYDAAGAIVGHTHPNFGGNVNEPLELGSARGLRFRAQPAPEPRLDQPVTVFATAGLAALQSPPADRPSPLTLESVDRLPVGGVGLEHPRQTVLWVEDAAADFPASLLQRLADAVRAGATLLFAGRSQPLLAAYAQATGGRPLEVAEGRPDMLFEDFEQGYGNWTIEGRCFGPEPPRGTLPNQQRVSGFLGQRLVNTYHEGDGTIGRATSRSFTVERRFLRCLIGGGPHADTQLRLVIGGRVVRRASGREREQLLPVSWDVGEFAGQTAHLEIVDEHTGPWGHVNVDQIEFSDQPANLAVFRLLESLLPARFTEVRPRRPASPGDPNVLEFVGLAPAGAAEARTVGPGLRVLAQAVGQGRVMVAEGAVLEAEQAGIVGLRQRAYATLCELVGAKYERAPDAGVPANAPGYGSLALAATAGTIACRGACEDLRTAWREFASSGRFDAPTATPSAPTASGRSAFGAVASTIEVPAGGELEVPFLLTWHYPNKYNPGGVAMGCHYTTRWPEAGAVLREAVAAFPDWRAKTQQFRRAFYDSTLPPWLLDCIAANAAIVRHVGVVFRIANGDTYGWEGSNGCCQPTCTHVWGYEQTLARLFPDLERDMRRIDFIHQQRADGGVNNRTEVPSPPRPTGEQPFADGHASCILKAWREALHQPDDAWLKEYWPRIDRAVEYLIARDAASHGGQPAGYLEDDQWNTYDEALHGVTTFISGYYLAALRAGEAWARRVGEDTAAARFRGVFERGRQRLVELCWNGEYYQQHLPGYERMPGEVGPGCMSDQLIGQWWAHQLGLGYLFPREQVVSALRSIFRYNFKWDLTGWKHAPRAFAGAGDRGLIICTWPKGGRPPHVMLYSDEVWTGIEYQVAAHMIYEGLIDEGLALVQAARQRYDGVPRPPIPRNPWNEIECGGHYARALSSWSLLLALAGWEYDGPAAALRFEPRWHPEDFRSFFCGPEGWGHAAQRRADGTQHSAFEVGSGAFALRRLTLATRGPATAVQARVAGQGRPARWATQATSVELAFDPPVRLRAGQRLEVEVQTQAV